MLITRSPLPQNNGNLPSAYFGGNFPIAILENIYCISTGSPGYYFSLSYILYKNRGDDYPNSLNLIANYHYHGENRVISR